jgi:hypothetical protein
MKRNVPFEMTGGGKVGWLYASWPFAQLSSTPDRLIVAIMFLGTYSFAPEQVTSIEDSGSGVRIRHCVREYPRKIIFWAFSDSERVLTGIAKSGFCATASPLVPDERVGMPMRWSACAVAAAGFAVFLIDWLHAVNQWRPLKSPFPRPGMTAIIAGLVLFSLSFGTLRYPIVQRLVMKPGRDVGEIAGAVRFCGWAFGFCVVLFVIFRFAGAPP